MPARQSPKQSIASSATSSTAPSAVTPQEARDWLLSAVAEAAGLDPRTVDPHRPIAELGLSSRQLVTLAVRLAERTGRSVDPSLVFDRPTVAALVDAVYDATPASVRAAPATPASARPAPAAAGEPGDDIAIVSMACRFPGGADDPEALWRLLAAGEEAVGEVPADRWDTHGLHDTDPEATGTAYSLRGGYLRDIDRFDAAFFGISPREAAAMDPQQRLLLEAAWETFERAGIVPATLEGSSTGVYVGLYDSGYLASAPLARLDGHVGTGSASSVASGRIAYTLGLQGPAVTVDTACSSSLVALHLAARALVGGECDLALAGGASLLVTPRGHVEFSRLRGLSPSGRCSPFGAGADGVVWAEGCGLVLLKRLADARRDGDRVLAVVKSTALNQDGRSQGLSAPSGPAQERVLRTALDAAGLRPEDLDYVETHGTGTPLGDPIEGRALAAVFGPGRPADRPLGIGSLKSNIGHTQAAAGIGGVIKTVLSLGHGRLPATLHADTPTDRVAWARSGLRVLTDGRPWPRDAERVRRAGVSAFGISGTNAHVILEEAPADLAPETDGGPVAGAGEVPGGGAEERFAAGLPAVSTGNGVVPGAGDALVAGGAESSVRSDGDVSGGGAGKCLVSGDSGDGDLPAPSPGEEGDPSAAELACRAALFPLSARTLPALRAQAERLREALLARPYLPLPDVAATLARHRSHFEHRAVVQTGDRGELLAALRELTEGRAEPELVTGPGRGLPGGGHGKVAFVFPGQGSQWAGMARDLLAGDPVFADELDRCDTALRRFTGWSAAAVLRGDEGAPGLDRVDVVQPVLFAVMVSLAAVWRARGVRPDAVIGHSQGEVAAACVAGALSLNDAAAVVALRSQALTGVSGTGTMAVVGLPHTDVENRLTAFDGRVSVAAVNSARSTVVAGDVDGVESLLADLDRENAFTRRLDVDYASHSAQVEPVRAALLDELDGITASPSRVTWYSTVTGEPVTADLDADYWYTNLREPVRFAPTAARMAADGYRYFVELSPHPSLLTALQTVDEDLVAVGSLRRDEDGPACLDRAAAELHVHGRPLDWRRLVPRTGRPADLPTYAWDTERHWSEPTAARPGAAGLDDTGHALLTCAVAVADTGQLLLTGRLSLRSHPWLADHTVDGTALLPGTAFAELAVRAGDQAGCPVVEELTLHTPLAIAPGDAVLFQLWIEAPDADGRRRITVLSCADTTATGIGSTWTRHASGTLATGPTPPAAELTAWPPPEAAPVPVTGLYDRLDEAGYGYGPAFRGLTALWRTGDDLYAEVELPEPLTARPDGYGLHPALFDTALHALRAGDWFTRADGHGPLLLPFAWTGVHLHATGASRLRVRLRRTGPDEVTVLATDTTGAPVVTVDALRLREAAGGAVTVASARHRFDSLYEVDWTPVGEASADAPVPGGTTVVAVPAAGPVRETVAEALSAVQDWLDADHGADDRLVLVTRGAVATGPADGAPDPAQAAVWGLVRSAQAEHPGRFVLVDTDTDIGTRIDVGAEGPAVACALAVGEPQLAVRGSRLLAPRLSAVTGADVLVPPPDTSAWRLEPVGGGSLDGLALVPYEPADRPLAAGEVRIAVRAAGLNFRDVLITLGMVEHGAGLGWELAGEVLETGPEVTGLAPGERVLGLATGDAFAPVAVADARMLARIPEGWTYARAASVPMAYLTAFYGLVDLADLKAGESVLIHAAAGGVGTAAVQIARYLGAEVFGTASTGKWPTLRGQGLDERHISSSRDLGFEHAVREATGGRGVDVVLDSLSGEFVDASLRTLAPGGRFVEMGRTDIRDADEVAARHPGVHYRAFDLREAGPERLHEMLGEVLELFDSGALTPPPVTTWDIRRAADAFRHMSQARHVGKLVLTLPRTPDPDGTVLVTGATGTLGRLVARHLVAEHGVRHLLLAGRRGAAAAGMAEVVADIEESGATVTVAACDVADRDAVAALLAAIPEERPLTAVVHAAGVLDDGVVEQLTPERLTAVLRPKTEAALVLDELTADLDLAQFVLFSSAAGVVGSPGQANYAAANAALDALAARRRAGGRPALCLAWGLWAPASGMTGHLTDADLGRLAREGGGALTAEEGLALLDAALESGRTAVVPVKLDTARLARPVPHLLRGLVTEPARRATAQDVPAGIGTATADAGLAGQLAALPEAERAERALALVRKETAQALGLRGPNAVRPDQPLRDLGLDSLMAVELRNRLGNQIGARLPATLLFDHPTAAQVADHLLATVLAPSHLTAPAAPAVPARPTAPAADEPVALVAMACRLPGGVIDPEGLWRLLAEGRDAVGPFPAGRWDVESLYDPDPEARGKSYAREGGFLDDIESFDARFFGITPKEAAAMDPQQRLLLETAWEALEGAGIVPGDLTGTATGAYVGMMGSDYLSGARIDHLDRLDGYTGTGTAGSVASGRLAYALGLQGPAMTVDTACSSSLVAIHLAAQALRAGECDLALAGGVTLMVTPQTFVEFSRLRGLSPSGRCRSFSDAADGATWAEGVGVVVLKRLADARRDGDEVLAVLRGTAVGQDGRSQGLSAPNGPAQEQVIRRALELSGLTPADIDHVEAHGTGTTLGDPIEANALAAVFGATRPEGRPLYLGSLKSSIGHAQAAAGVAGLIKVVQSLRHGTLPPTLHADPPSRHVDWDGSGLRLLTGPVAWPRGERVRRAGLSAFGISGTNAHVVVEEAPPEDPRTGTERGPVAGPAPAKRLFVLSGREESTVRRQAARLAAHLARETEAPEDGVLTGGPVPSGDPVPSRDPVPSEAVVPSGGGAVAGDIAPAEGAALSGGTALAGATALDGHTAAADVPALPDVAHTLARHRTHFERRAALVAGDREELLAGLTALASGRTPLAPPREEDGGKTAFVFAGHGGQWPGMGMGLFAGSEAFRGELTRIDEVVRRHAGWSVLDVLRAEDPAPLKRTDILQPVLFAVNAALAAAWRALGVTPDAVVGHSLGEIAAAYSAGALGLDDAVTVITGRAQTVVPLAGKGGMVSLDLPRPQVEELLAPYPGRLFVAAVNSPHSTAVSGDAEALADLTRSLREQGLTVRRLSTAFASHTPLMEPLRAELLARFADVRGTDTPVALYSTVAGEPVPASRLDAAHWFANLAEPVRFADTVRRMLDDGYRHFVELSPHSSLSASVEAVAADAGVEAFTVASLRRHEDGHDILLRRLGELYSAGHTPDWRALFPAGRRVHLPAYAFTRERHWLAPTPAAPAATGFPLLGTHVESSDEPGRHLFQTDLDLRDDRYAYLADHRVGGEVWLPAAAFLDMALRAATVIGDGDGSQAAGDGDVDGFPAAGAGLADVRFLRPLRLEAGTPVRLQLVVRPAADGSQDFTISSAPAGKGRMAWETHVQGRFTAVATPASEAAPDLAEWRERCAEPADLTGVYADLTARGIEYGPAFRCLEQAHRAPEAAVGRLTRRSAEGHLLHPAVLDAAFHTAAVPGQAPQGRAFVPAGAGRLRFTGRTAPPAWVTCALRSVAGDSATLDIRLYDEEGHLLLEIREFELAALSPLDNALFETRWHPCPPAQEPPAPGAWLLLADTTGVADALAERLAAASVPYVMAHRGREFADQGYGRYVLDPADPAQLTRLLDEAFPAGPPGRVVQLTALDAPPVGDRSTAEEAAGLCCLDTLRLVRALTDRVHSRPPRLFVVVRGSQAAGDSTEVTRPEQALAWGFGLSVAQEHPELATTLIDLPPTHDMDDMDGTHGVDGTDGTHGTDAVDALWTQLRHADDERLVALRAPGRLVPRLTRTRPDDGGHGIVGPDGVYLVTGGLGGLGRVVAERLVALGARSLALLGRGTPTEEAAAWIEGLERCGVTVRLARADVADRDGLAAALDTVRRKSGPIAMVVHAAGVIDDATVANLTDDRVLGVLAPKVLGTALLTELVPEAADLVLFASAAGLLGSAGQSHYAAANAFLDAWAHHLSRTGRRALSLDWGAWAGVGMAAGTGADGLIAFSPQDGGELFTRVLPSARRQLTPLALDRAALALDPGSVRTRPLLAGLVTVPAESAQTGDGLVESVFAATTDPERTQRLEAYVRARIGEVSGGAVAASATTALKELGLDSLMLVRLRNTFARQLGVELPAASVFSASDVRALARTLAEALPASPGGRRQEPDADRRPAATRVPATELRPATRDIVRLLRSAHPDMPDAAHTVGLAVRLTEPDGPASRETFEAVVDGLAARHAALRTAIVTDAEGRRGMRVARELPEPLLRWTPVPDDEEPDTAGRLRRLMEEPFDLARAPLWRFEVLDTGDRGRILVFGGHHAVSDLQSLLLVAAEIAAGLSGSRLDATVTNRDIDLLIEAQEIRGSRRPRGSGEPGTAEADWREAFEGSARLDLTLTRPRPKTRSYRAGTVTVPIPDGLMDRVSEAASRLAVTPAAFCLGALTVLLARRRERELFVLAVPVDTRIHADAFDAVGFYGVPVPFPAEARAAERVEDVLRRTDARLARILAKGAMFSDVLPVLARQGLHRADAPLVEVYFNFVRSAAGDLTGLEVLPAGTGWSDLDLMIIMSPDMGTVRLDHNIDILDATAAAGLGEELVRLLGETAEDSTAAVRRAMPVPTAPEPVPVRVPVPESEPALAPVPEPPAPAPPGTLALAATFALGHLPALCEAAVAEGAPDADALTVSEAPYHHVLASLRDPSGVLADPATAVAVVLLRATDFQRFGPVDDSLLAELRTAYPAALRALAERTRKPLVVGFVPSARAEDRFTRWEREVAAELAEAPGIAVLDADGWTRRNPVPDPFDERTEKHAHLPFAPHFQAAVALRLAEVVRAVRRPVPKVIAVDGDETLWGGVAGEAGADAVDLTGPRALLARRLLRWREAGALLALVSNNDEETVRAVLDRPDSLLKAEHFSVLCAAWGPKPGRLADAARTLNLGLDSFLFLDDNPAEIAKMRAALPQVLSVTCPPAARLESFLGRLWPLVPAAATAEDTLRARFYEQERQRDAVRADAGEEFEAFLAQLELKVDIRPLTDPDVQRGEQLVRRTNQFTLRARSADGGDLTRWREHGEVWTAAARDRFGDYGQIGLLAVRADGDRLDVLGWLMSCRALGRGVEERLLQWLADRATGLGCAEVRLTAEHTPRNAPARRLLAALGGGDPDDDRLEALVTPGELRAFRSWRQK
ncbi:type I polyketide synthase [Streptomyces sp. AS02]|uniref:type I polyketide synthase n=1 Tax=Streptomyces sp. AS02 TaxID=2938946 RepID=UPI00201FF20B|nr:type I polyketide synthase [Streptomyces sp. AS02]MCL8014926.1 SDR family NAD(P)-dependent oxidoreductase [Streptomyces sp. AS02]